MFGLGFLNSVFLFALSAMALPVIIHILSRRRVRRIPFSTLAFIHELSRRRMRKVNLRRILILVLRTLAILLIVMAFARPTLRGAAAVFFPGGAPKGVVICLDASYSMGVERETGTAFTRAKEIAKRIVDESGKEDWINLVTFSTRTEAMFEKGTRNKHLVKNTIEKSSITAEGTSIERAMRKAYELIGDSDAEGGEVYVISDFRDVGDSTLVPEVPRGIRAMLLPVYTEAVDNVSIDRVLVPRKLIRAGEVIRVAVMVSNRSKESPADFTLELIVDGKRKAEKVLHLEPAASTTVDFSIAFNEWGLYHGTITKSSDRLRIDDERHFLLEVSRSVPVTLIRGLKQRPGVTQAASYFYVEKALNPRRIGEGEFTVRIVDERELTASDLPARGVVVWTDPQRVERKRLELITRYVDSGGGLMIFLGSGSRGLWADHVFMDLIGIEGASSKDAVRGERLTSFQKDHPIFNIFTQEELELLSRASVKAYVSTRGVAPDSVIAYMSSGDPAIWERTRGEGKLILFSVAPDMESGDIPLSPMFLPLIHTSVSYLASAERASRLRENFVGSELLFDLPELLGGEVLCAAGGALVVDHAGARLKPVIYESPGGETAAILERPPGPGFYRLVSDTTRIAEAAVNLDTRESDLNPLLLGDEVIGGASIVDTGDEFGDKLKEAREGREVYAIFLLLAAAALAGESLLGRRA